MAKDGALMKVALMVKVGAPLVLVGAPLVQVLVNAGNFSFIFVFFTEIYKLFLHFKTFTLFHKLLQCFGYFYKTFALFHHTFTVFHVLSQAFSLFHQTLTVFQKLVQKIFIVLSNFHSVPVTCTKVFYFFFKLSHCFSNLYRSFSLFYKHTFTVSVSWTKLSHCFT